MLNLIDELTNWYIRFNRRRLKGEGGLEDCQSALNTLFETLFTLARTMVSMGAVELSTHHADVSDPSNSPHSRPSSPKTSTKA